jgi:tetratricopeptide (TPR) repeat protein
MIGFSLGLRAHRRGSETGASWLVSFPAQVSSAKASRKGVPMSESNPRIQRAQVFFKTANDAALKNNYDYAIQMYQECCKLDPENLVYRQALRGIERRKFNNSPSKVSKLVGARNQPIRARANVAKAKGQYGHVLEVCEDAFVHNPWDVSASLIAAEAAERLGLNELAQWLLESVATVANDADFFRHLAHIYEVNKHYNNAIQCWEKVKKLVPTDEFAGRHINSLSANATIVRSGLTAAIDKASQGSSGPEPAQAEQEDGEHRGLSHEEQLRKEIEEQPQRVSAYLELADFYKTQGRLDEAEKVLALGLKHIPADTLLQEVHGEIQLDRLSKKFEYWSRKAEADPSDLNAKAKAEQVAGKRNEYEITELRRRLKLNSGNLNLHFRLGQCLAKSGQHDLAIAEFQLARSSPELKVEALRHAGLSFEANGVMKLAERSYQDALKALEASDPEDQATANELHYRLGRVAESMGNFQSAEDHYNEVAANDYAYLDVAQRLRSLNQGPSS